MGQRLLGQVVADEHPASRTEVELGRVDGAELPEPGVPCGGVGLEGVIDDHLAVLVRAVLSRARGRLSRAVGPGPPGQVPAGTRRAGKPS